MTSQLAATTSNVRLEVEKSVREITTSYREMLCQAHAVMGNLSEIEYLKSRWEASLDEQRSSSVLLDDLLNAHDRLARSEGLYATALVGYNEGFAKLNQATGTLVDCQHLRRRGRVCSRSGASTRRRRRRRGPRERRRAEYGRQSAISAKAVETDSYLADVQDSCAA